MELEGGAPVFVVGAPRSGTTLVQLLIASHGAFFTFPETHLFTHVLPRLAPPDELRAEGFATLFEVLAGKPDLRFSAAARAAIVAELSENGVLGPRELLQALICGFRVDGDRQGRRWIEKTPRHVNHLPAILSTWPEAQIVHVYRDPRDVISSFHSRREFAHAVERYEDLSKRIEQYKTCIRSRLKTDSGRIIDLRYEDLVRRPETELGRVMTFIGETLEPRQLQEFGGSYSQGVTESETHKRLSGTGEIHDRRQVWRDRLTGAEAWCVETACSREMRRLGYPSSADAPSPSTRLRVRALLATARLRPYTHRAKRAVLRIAARIVRGLRGN